MSAKDGKDEESESAAEGGKSHRWRRYVQKREARRNARRGNCFERDEGIRFLEPLLFV
jgi:hypothetical protein